MKLFILFLWFLGRVLDAILIGLVLLTLYAAANNQACLRVWDYTYGVCPDFYKE